MSSQPVVDRDAELLEKVSKGDQEAFGELYDLTHGKVYAYLYGLLQDRPTAEDVLVETYTEVWRCAEKFKRKSSVSTWIMGIGRNLAMNELRRSQRHESMDDQAQISNGATPDHGESMDRRRLLKEALPRLSVKHREILDLVFFHEMTYGEVSELLGIPVSTVKTRVFYAKEALRGILSGMRVRADEV